MKWPVVHRTNQSAELNTHLLKLWRTQRSNSTTSCTGARRRPFTAQISVSTCSHEAQTHQHLTCVSEQIGAQHKHLPELFSFAPLSRYNFPLTGKLAMLLHQASWSEARGGLHWPSGGFWLAKKGLFCCKRTLKCCFQMSSDIVNIELVLAAEADWDLPSSSISFLPDHSISCCMFLLKCNFSSFCSSHSLVCLHYSSLPSPTIQRKCTLLDFVEKAFKRPRTRSESMLDLPNAEFPTRMEEGSSKRLVWNRISREKQNRIKWSKL